MKLILREKLEHVARKVLRYTLQDAEKDYVMTMVMQQIQQSAIADQMIFKGGTAIHHCYLEQLRFSEDLDFSSTNTKLTMKELKQIFASDSSFEVKKEFTSPATLKIEKLKYYGILDTPNSIKVEVDRQQSVYLPAKHMAYSNAWGLEFDVLVMDPIEIGAEKIRACNDRFRYRDFYDLYMMVSKFGIDIERSIKLLPKKEIRTNISKTTILQNLDYALEEVTQKADTISYREEIDSHTLVRFMESLYIPDLSTNTDA